jgi:hypothetical protein
MVQTDMHDADPPCSGLLRLGWIDGNEKNSREQPKEELWIHGRAYYGQWVCHSPNIMKTDIFAGTTGSKSGKSTRGEYQI